MSLNQLQQIVSKTFWRYVIAGLIITFISTFSFWSTQSAIEEQEADAHIINLAGRQRMLSQRIALLSLERRGLVDKPAEFKRNAEALHFSAHLMRESHQALIDSTPEQSIKTLYFNHGQPSLNELVIRYTDEAKFLANLEPTQFPISEKLSILSAQHVKGLLQKLDKLVLAYEQSAKKRVQNVKSLQLILWLLMMTSMVIIAWYILRPSLSLIRNSLLQEKQKQNRIQLASDSANMGIWEYQIDTSELIWDTTMWRIFNDGKQSDPDETYTIFKERLHPMDQSQVLSAFYDAINNQTPFHIEFRIITPSLQERTIKADAIIEYDAEGNTTAIVGTNQDITEGKQREQAIINARIEAEHAARVKGDFLASMSHEIRTPMNGIMGMLELLKNTNLDTVQAQRVSIALSSAKSLLVLINDILDFSKIEADRLQLEYIDFNLRNLLGELSQSLSQLAETKGIELILDTIDVHEDMVRGDPGRIRQLMTNLISNAIKFTHEGQVLIQVSLADLNPQEWRLNFKVKDSGIGIAKDKQRYLFEAFSQADSSTTREYGGTGLGLAIVKRLCEIMSGRIDIKSKVDQGSEFYGHITLQKSERSIIVAPEYDISKLSILIVDDNQINREVLSQQLEIWGAQVEKADSAVNAMKAYTTHYEATGKPFDIALLDMQMPHTSGTELGQKIKHDPRFKDTHLVLMTSMLINNDHHTLAHLGFCGYFSKPVTTDDIFMALNVIGEGGEALKGASPLLTHDYLSSLQLNPAASDEEIRTNISDVSIKKVLLVEDNAINQMVAKDTLEELGLYVETAENGQEAIDLLRTQNQNRYALIFMDCQMPVMDGYLASQQIRQGNAGEHHKKTPIIALTANAMKEDRDKCFAAGMNDFISKPMDIESLKASIHRWLINSD